MHTNFQVNNDLIVACDEARAVLEKACDPLKQAKKAKKAKSA